MTVLRVLCVCVCSARVRSTLFGNSSSVHHERAERAYYGSTFNNCEESQPSESLTRAREVRNAPSAHRGVSPRFCLLFLCGLKKVKKSNARREEKQEANEETKDRGVSWLTMAPRLSFSVQWQHGGATTCTVIV